MAELALEPTLDLGDYLGAFRRRRILIGLIAGVILILGLIVAFIWPPTYQASATILIEEQEIPTDLVRTTITSYAAQRIQVISQRVMTRQNMLEIMDKYGLYTEDRKRKTTEEVLENMREDIQLDMITAEVMDPRSGRPTAATIAFSLGFQGENPQQVQRVASELTTLYLNENLKTRTEKTQETYEFLTEESKHLSDEITRLEATLAEFKERNINTLPEQRDMNMQALERTEREIATIDIKISGLEERKIYLDGQLALLDPYVVSSEILSPSARLDALRTQYIIASTRYSPDHPDVINIKREIQALEMETGNVESASDKRAQLEILRQELAKAEQQYTDVHPDVKSLKRQIVRLEDDLRKPAPATPSPRTQSTGADNPAYVNLQSQLAAANSEIRSLKTRRAELVDKLAEYEERLMLTPKVEQEYRAIARDLNNATTQYQEVKAKQRTAEVAQSMEKERKGEKFTLIDPAILPEEPISPNRPAIIFLSLVLALGAGIGSAAVAESMDSAVRGTKGLVTILHTAPLAVIPYLANETEIRQQKTRRLLFIAAVVAAIAAVLLLIHFLVSPLDVLWFRGMRKMDNIIEG